VNRDVLVRWVAALRSGDYLQGREHLRYEDEDGVVRHCCLGVLCELAVADGVIERAEPFKLWQQLVRGYAVPERATTETSVLPPAVVAWAGLSTDSPSVRHPSLGPVELTVLNDGRSPDGDVTEDDVYLEPVSFAVIADLLESGDPT
jgi:hypothetical protein